LEELGNGKGKLAKASEEGQGPRRAVEPMMMMVECALDILAVFEKSQNLSLSIFVLSARFSLFSK
jgi:hypothetical protein